METFSVTSVTENEIIEIINNLHNSSPGNDEIPIKIIKEVSIIIAPALLHLCNSSFLTGIFPDDLRIAKITPIYKTNRERI